MKREENSALADLKDLGARGRAGSRFSRSPQSRPGSAPPHPASRTPGCCGAYPEGAEGRQRCEGKAKGEVSRTRTSRGSLIYGSTTGPAFAGGGGGEGGGSGRGLTYPFFPHQQDMQSSFRSCLAPPESPEPALRVDSKAVQDRNLPALRGEGAASRHLPIIMRVPAHVR